MKNLLDIDKEGMPNILNLKLRSNIYSLFKLIKIFKFHYLFDKVIIIFFYMNNKYNKPTFLL